MATHRRPGSLAYASRADEAGFALDGHPAIRSWIDRVRAQPGHLAVVHAYAADPHAGRDLP